MEPIIHLSPADAWNFFTKNRARLGEELVEIATNGRTNTSVYMTEEDGNPYLYVYQNDKKVYQEKCVSAFDAEKTLRSIYTKYMSHLEVVTGNHDEEDGDDDMPPCDDIDAMTDAEFQDMVNEREDVICRAFQDFVEVLTEDSLSAMEFSGLDDDNIYDVVDHIVEYLAIECGFRIRRPMTITDDDSELEVRTEYPYEEYDFSEDERHG